MTDTHAHDHDDHEGHDHAHDHDHDHDHHHHHKTPERVFTEPVFENIKLDEGGVTFDVKIDVRPEVKLQGYEKVTVDVPRRSINDQEVDQTVESLRERLAAFDTVTRPAAPGDHLVIDYVPLA